MENEDEVTKVSQSTPMSKDNSETSIPKVPVTSTKLPIGCKLMLCYACIFEYITVTAEVAFKQSFLILAYEEASIMRLVMWFIADHRYLFVPLGGYIADNYIGRTKAILTFSLGLLNGLFFLFISGLSKEPTNVMVPFLLFVLSTSSIMALIPVIAADQLPHNSHAYEKVFVVECSVRFAARFLALILFSIFRVDKKCTSPICYRRAFSVSSMMYFMLFIFLVVIQPKLIHVKVDKNILQRVWMHFIDAQPKRTSDTSEKMNDKRHLVVVAKKFLSIWPIYLFSYVNSMSYYSIWHSFPDEHKTMYIPFESYPKLHSFFRNRKLLIYLCRLLGLFMFLVLHPLMRAKGLFSTFYARYSAAVAIMLFVTVNIIFLRSKLVYDGWTPRIPKGYSSFYFLNLGSCDVDIIGIQPRIVYQIPTVPEGRQSHYRMLVKQKNFTVALMSVCMEKNVSKEFEIPYKIGHRYTISFAVHSKDGERETILMSKPSCYDKRRKDLRKGFGIIKFVMSPYIVLMEGHLRLRNENNTSLKLPFTETNRTENTVLESDYIMMKTGVYTVDYQFGNKSIDLNTVVIHDKEVVVFAIYNNLENPKTTKIVEDRGLKRKSNGFIWSFLLRILVIVPIPIFLYTVFCFLYLEHPSKTRAFGLSLSYMCVIAGRATSDLLIPYLRKHQYIFIDDIHMCVITCVVFCLTWIMMMLATSFHVFKIDLFRPLHHQG